MCTRGSGGGCTGGPWLARARLRTAGPISWTAVPRWWSQFPFWMTTMRMRSVIRQQGAMRTDGPSIRLTVRLQSPPASNVALVDPADANRVLSQLSAMESELARMMGGQKPCVTTVLCTHLHHDHAGGNWDVRRARPGVSVVSGAKDGAAGTTIRVRHGDEVGVGKLRVAVLDTPCHTRVRPAAKTRGSRPWSPARARCSGPRCVLSGVAAIHGR